MYDIIKKHLIFFLQNDTTFTESQIKQISDFIDAYEDKHVYTQHNVPTTDLYTLSDSLKSVYYKIISIVKSWF